MVEGLSRGLGCVWYYLAWMLWCLLLVLVSVSSVSTRHFIGRGEVKSECTSAPP